LLLSRQERDAGEVGAAYRWDQRGPGEGDVEYQGHWRDRRAPTPPGVGRRVDGSSVHARPERWSTPGRILYTLSATFLALLGKADTDKKRTRFVMFS
jgi:hypothetical protein